MLANSSPNPSRYLLIDLLRWVSFYAIVIFHLTYALWAPGGWTEVPIHGPLIWPLETFARIFAFSGFTILFLSFFLFGHRATAYRPLRLLLWLLPFAVVWAAFVEDSFFAWDIYPFLIVTLMGLAVGIHLRIPLRLWIVGSAIALSLPFWLIESQLPISIRAALVGACETRKDLGDWPLFPWFFLASFAYGLGRWGYNQKCGLQIWRWRELVIWGPLLASSLPFLGAYFSTPLGEHFGCFIFRRNFVEVWAHLIWLLFVIRLSLVAKINTNLFHSALVRRISRSPVNRAFFLIYFAHYPLVMSIGLWARRWDLDFQTWILTLSFAMIMLIVEMSPGVLWQKINANSSTT